MKVSHNRGVVTFIILTIIAVFLALFVFGYCTEQHPFGLPNYAQNVTVSCGITVTAPNANEVASFPYTVKGYVNGCGWDPASDGTIGTITLLGSNGLVLVRGTLTVTDPSGGDPYSFAVTLAPPFISTGDLGAIVIDNTQSGFDHHSVQIPIRFGAGM